MSCTGDLSSRKKLKLRTGCLNLPVPAIAHGRLGCAGLGYLIGPTIGTLLFKAFNGSKNKSMEIMDKR